MIKFQVLFYEKLDRQKTDVQILLKGRNPNEKSK